MQRSCAWCGDVHGPTQLCQRAQSGMSRRSFCFLFATGVAGLTLVPQIAFSQSLPTEGVLTWRGKTAVFPFGSGRPIRVPVLPPPPLGYWVGGAMSKPVTELHFDMFEFRWSGQVDAAGRAIYT